jgi:D-alanyl-D-alanine carboxypeptidase
MLTIFHSHLISGCEIALIFYFLHQVPPYLYFPFMYKNLLFILSALLFSASYSQSLNVKKLDSLFTVLQNRHLATGSVAISINGKPAYQKAIGFISLDSNQNATPDINTKYRIGSVSKMFTAVMIFQLIEEGKLSLSQTLNTFFPQIPNADKITIKNMLYHRSGLHDYTRDTNFPDWMNQSKTKEELLKIIADKSPDFEPDAKADYCNSNYLLLSYIIEKVCNCSYADVLKKKIISKTGLTNTYYGKPIDRRRNESSSYKYANGSWGKEKETNVSIHQGAGSIVSTPGDLTVFIYSLFNGRLISKASLTSMTTLIDGYGIGIFPYERGYGHNGRIEEFYSAVRYYPEHKIAVSYITNGILYPRTDILDGILKICFNKDYTIPFSSLAVLQNIDIDKYTGAYSSGDLPFKVVCKNENGKLIIEAAGKSMKLEPVNAHYFMNVKNGAFFEFTPRKGTLQIKETDNVYYLKKE